MSSGDSDVTRLKRPQCDAGNMKKLFSSPDSAEVDLLKNILADAGVVCEVRNGALAQIVPAPPFYEELWVSEESFAKAAEIVAGWERPAAAPASGWTCAQCSEIVGGEFTSCWKCGTQRPQMV